MFFIIVSSFVFYGWWDWRFLFLILFSGIVDFYAALLIQKYPKSAKLLFILSISVNLASLAMFKYSVFFAEQVENLLGFFSITVQLKEQLPAFTLILPIGISFYTFQSMSYTIDVYRGRLQPTKNIAHFFSYLVMFPQLVAGPIVRAKDFLNQLRENREVSKLEFWNGIKLIVIGYFQKTVLADNLGVIVNTAFEGVNNGTGLYWWVVMICFSFQIYFDFNGYSQIARGLAKLMGYHFKMNFNHPYLATSLKDFWSRWHISLSTWFRDYVYIPLGGSKKGRIRAHINIWVTMFLSGLWHGAAFNFVLWGIFHGFALSIERLSKNSLRGIQEIKSIRWILTMIQVLIGWVFFRSTSLEQISDITFGMFTVNFDVSFLWKNENVFLFLLLALVYEFVYFLSRTQNKVRRFKNNATVEAFGYSILIILTVFFRGPETEFIYFQF
jgi:D-alanyl-lipoteichoic acid acyltransferase DltB (MBOAT superfamily)